MWGKNEYEIQILNMEFQKNNLKSRGFYVFYME